MNPNAQLRQAQVRSYARYVISDIKTMADCPSTIAAEVRAYIRKSVIQKLRYHEDKAKSYTNWMLGKQPTWETQNAEVKQVFADLQE